jgi:hypothetical protein
MNRKGLIKSFLSQKGLVQSGPYKPCDKAAQKNRIEGKSSPVTLNSIIKASPVQSGLKIKTSGLFEKYPIECFGIGA